MVLSSGISESCGIRSSGNTFCRSGTAIWLLSSAMSIPCVSVSSTCNSVHFFDFASTIYHGADGIFVLFK